MGRKVLIIIDPQYGFISGSLSVNGAITAMDKLAEFIEKNHDDFYDIVITSDWHPRDHCSFNVNGGQWPVHCIKGSLSAEIYDAIMNAVLDNCPNKLHILTKGTDPNREEYSVLKNEESRERLMGILSGCDDVTICGIALDYCVKDSITDLVSVFPPNKITLIENFSPCIGDAEKTIAELSNLGINILKLQ